MRSNIELVSLAPKACFLHRPVDNMLMIDNQFDAFSDEMSNLKTQFIAFSKPNVFQGISRMLFSVS